MYAHFVRQAGYDQVERLHVPGLPDGWRLNVCWNAREQRYVLCRMEGGGKVSPFINFKGKERPSEEAVLQTLYRILWKCKNDAIKPNAMPEEDEIEKSTQAQLDATHEERARSLRSTFKNEDIAMLIPDRTDGKGPNGGGKFYGAAFDRNQPIVDRRSAK